MDLSNNTLAWFTGTPFGAPFDPLDPAVYEAALTGAAFELMGVHCYCPDFFDYALAIQISLMLNEFAPTEDGQIAPGGANHTGHKAYVKKDTVFDVTREYQLQKVNPEIEAAGPPGILARIKAKCKTPLTMAAFHVASFPAFDACGCKCSPGMIGVGDKSDTAWQY